MHFFHMLTYLLFRILPTFGLLFATIKDIMINVSNNLLYPITSSEKKRKHKSKLELVFRDSIVRKRNPEFLVLFLIYHSERKF